MAATARKRARVSREEWSKRVARWNESGLTAAEFAAKLGINPGTLTYWKWTLARRATTQPVERGSRKAASKQPPLAARKGAQAAFVEVHGTSTDDWFELELELGRGRLVRVPPSFDAQGLRRLLGVLEVT